MTHEIVSIFPRAVAPDWAASDLVSEQVAEEQRALAEALEPAPSAARAWALAGVREPALAE